MFYYRKYVLHGSFFLGNRFLLPKFTCATKTAGTVVTLDIVEFCFKLLAFSRRHALIARDIIDAQAEILFQECIDEATSS